MNTEKQRENWLNRRDKYEERQIKNDEIALKVCFTIIILLTAALVTAGIMYSAKQTKTRIIHQSCPYHDYQNEKL